jgi:hypothetical protein
MKFFSTQTIVAALGLGVMIVNASPFDFNHLNLIRAREPIEARDPAGAFAHRKAPQKGTGNATKSTASGTSAATGTATSTAAKSTGTAALNATVLDCQITYRKI